MGLVNDRKPFRVTRRRGSTRATEPILTVTRTVCTTHPAIARLTIARSTRRPMPYEPEA